jgi:transglycosylase-like protein
MRFVAGLVTGATIMLIGGAAVGIHAQSDVSEAAAAAGIPEIELAGAINSQPGVSPWQYLRWEGKLAPLMAASVSEPAYGGVWDRLAGCEASGDWHNARNSKYKGGLQMDATFWARYGGLAYASAPHLATRAQQIAVATRGQAVQGWAAWPVCSRQLGLR